MSAPKSIPIEIRAFTREEAKEILRSMEPFERKVKDSNLTYTLEFVPIPFGSPTIYQAVIGLRGNTFSIKESLKKTGWQWNSTEKQWQFISEKPWSFVQKISEKSSFEIVRDPLEGF